ncbi:N(6)-L-threonylcarbamoyladenine synthase Kae1 [archaeon]|nr:N(6)-L-threonylcarbamoyladenine synthase Kae1 [archaeon]
MICLGIESTAHTLGVGIMDSKGKVLANEKDSYTTQSGGIVPIQAAKHHEEVFNEILKRALDKSKVNLKEVNLISIANGPGLAPCLLVGLKKAKGLAKLLEVPLVGVNHCIAHLEIGKLFSNAKDPIFVFTSGANTQIIAHEGGRYRVFGECLSIAIGNALDKFGRAVGLGFPAGQKIEELAKRGEYIELPYRVKGMDVDFSGIVTKAVELFKKGKKIEDLCFSLQETCFAMLTEVTERALAHCDKQEALLIGGVAANQRFCLMLSEMCKAREARFYAAPLEYAGDQGAMIAWQGLLQFLSDKAAYKIDKEIDIKPRWRIDDIETSWIGSRNIYK